jgi:hypothetical protein
MTKTITTHYLLNQRTPEDYAFLEIYRSNNKQDIFNQFAIFNETYPSSTFSITKVDRITEVIAMSNDERQQLLFK